MSFRITPEGKQQKIAVVNRVRTGCSSKGWILGVFALGGGRDSWGNTTEKRPREHILPAAAPGREVSTVESLRLLTWKAQHSASAWSCSPPETTRLMSACHETFLTAQCACCTWAGAFWHRLCTRAGCDRPNSLSRALVAGRTQEPQPQDTEPGAGGWPAQHCLGALSNPGAFLSPLQRTGPGSAPSP